MSHRLPLKDIQFIADFAAFCRTKGDAEYQYSSNCNCAVAQFLRESGRVATPYVAGSCTWFDSPRRDGPLNYPPEGVHRAVQPAYYCEAGNETFSALADRLEALLVDAPVVERG